MQKYFTMEKKNPIEEAKRYLQNAKDILKEKAGKEGKFYTDAKYVKMAGNTAWNGVLVALDYAFGFKKEKGRKDIKDYKEMASKFDKKLLMYVNEGYNTLHLAMGYDGNKIYQTCASGMEIAEDIIKWCEKRTQKV